MPTGVYTRTPRPPVDPLPRFWAKVKKTETCWLWTGGVDKDGYGRFWAAGATQRAHVWIFERLVRPLGEGEQCCHTCDTPGCVRYDLHLYPGTQSQNIQDALSRGRFPQAFRDRQGENRGERNGNHRLTTEQVLAIRAEYQPSVAPYTSPTSLRSLAEKYGVSKYAITYALKGWKHLTTP